MAIWSGRRKALTILLFLAPTLIGIALFNIFPIVYNTYISFTNRNQFHPNPDCSIPLTGLIEPSCWPAFRANAPKGLAEPFRIADPLFSNYTTLLGSLFTTSSLLALLHLVVVIVPLIVAARVNRHYDQQVSRPVSSLLVWGAGAVTAVLIALLVNAQNAYTVLMESGDFFYTVFRTVLYVLACVPLFFIVGLGLALILNSSYIKGRTFFRSVMIVPWAASTMAVMMSLIWQFFFRDRGTINQVLNLLGVKTHAFLLDPAWAFGICVLVNLYYSYPFFFNVILGALQSIPPDQYEAAEMDGAGFWQQLNHITLPLIRPAVLPAVILSSITTFQMFGTVWALTLGGPSRGAGQPGFTEMVMIYAYKQVFQYNAYAKAGAFAVIIFILLFTATLYSARVTRLTKGAYE